MRKQLEPKTVYEIYKAEGTISEIAKKFGVSVSTVRRIKSLQYKKYKDIVEYFENNFENNSENNSENKDQKSDEEIIEAEKVNPELDKYMKIKEKIKKLNKEMLIADLIAILEKYFTPIIIKCVFDNILQNEKFQKLLNATVDQIKKADDPKFYVEAVKTLILGLLLQILKEEQIPKILGG